MMLHPILGTTGFDQLMEIRPIEGPEHHATAKAMLINAVAAVLKEKSPLSQSAVEVMPAPNTATPTPSNKTNKRIAALRKMKAQAEASNLEALSLSSAPTPKERATSIVESFLGFKFDAIQELEQQLIRMNKDPSKESIDWSSATEDLLYFSSKFILLEWWKSVGRKKWPEIYLVFCIWIAFLTPMHFRSASLVCAHGLITHSVRV